MDIDILELFFNVQRLNIARVHIMVNNNLMNGLQGPILLIHYTWFCALLKYVFFNIYTQICWRFSGIYYYIGSLKNVEIFIKCVCQFLIVLRLRIIAFLDTNGNKLKTKLKHNMYSKKKFVYI